MQNGKELNAWEAAAREMGRKAKVLHLDEQHVFSDAAMIAFATGLARIYLSKDLQRLGRYDSHKSTLLYVSFFMRGYEAT